MTLPTTHRAPLELEFRLAARALLAMEQGRNLDAALVAATQGLAPASRGAVRNMAYQAARRLGSTRALLARLASRPPAPEVAALLHTALSQMLDGRRHDAVVVDQAVQAAGRSPDTARACGFVNALLRRFGREREALLAAVQADPEARHEHPRWWIEALRADHPAHWEDILAAAALPPPMSLRANVRRTTADALQARLAAEGIVATRAGEAGLVLAEPRDVQALPGFEAGECSVQDLGAQRAASLLDVHDGHRVLDACAAPGGKTAHLLETADCELLALDVDAERLPRVEGNLARLGLMRPGVALRAADAARPDDWWDGRPFDRILLDAPCSASGIVRRHPDVRWLRQSQDAAKLSRTQGALLRALWPLLAPGGTLLYATCSVFRTENHAVVDAFLAATPDAGVLPLEGSDDGRLQLLPRTDTAAPHDGFFYTRLSKAA